MPNESYIPKEQEGVLLNIINNSKPFYERIPKIYVNFSKGNDRFGDRKNSLNIIPKHLLEKNEADLTDEEIFRLVVNNNICVKIYRLNKKISFTIILYPQASFKICHKEFSKSWSIRTKSIFNVRFVRSSSRMERISM